MRKNLVISFHFFSLKFAKILIKIHYSVSAIFFYVFIKSRGTSTLEVPLIKSKLFARLLLCIKKPSLHISILQVVWPPGKLSSTSGDVFFFEAKVHSDSAYFWVNFFGSSDDAKNFIVKFSIHNMNYRERFIYEGPVHTLDKKHNDIIGKDNCFSIKLDAVLRCLNNLKCLNIMITIKNQIEMNFEESDESKSGESDDSEDKESDESEKKPTVKKRRRS